MGRACASSLFRSTSRSRRRTLSPEILSDRGYPPKSAASQSNRETESGVSVHSRSTARSFMYILFFQSQPPLDLRLCVPFPHTYTHVAKQNSLIPSTTESIPRPSKPAVVCPHRQGCSSRSSLCPRRSRAKGPGRRDLLAGRCVDEAGLNELPSPTGKSAFSSVSM